jgi:hypothetical protein
MTEYGFKAKYSSKLFPNSANLPNQPHAKAAHVARVALLDDA